MNISTYFKQKRYMVYTIITIITITIPFIQINGNQVFLLSFDRKQLHLLGIAFEMQELYLMPFLLIILFIGIFLITTLSGRMWCGWGCPHTIFRVIYRDIIETKILKLRSSTYNKQKEPNLNTTKNKVKKIVAILMWSIISLIIACNFLLYFVQPSDFIEYIIDYQNHPVLLGFIIAIALFLIIDIIFIQENFCIYVCPYARVQSVLYDNQTQTVIYDIKRGSPVYNNGIPLKKNEITGECVSCLKCVYVCPTHIDIRKGMQLECINCLECVDACSSVMSKFNKESLVRWTSLEDINNGNGIKYIRGKTIGYMIVLLIAICSIAILSYTKSTMLLNINRTTESYKILENGDIENHYIMLFHNTDNKDHEYYLRILDNDNNIQIKQPSNSFKIKANGKVKKRVYLYTTDNINEGANDKILPITIEAYAVDDENIKNSKKSIFVYPKQ